MRVIFPRLKDGSRSYGIVERSDGVRYRLHEGIAGPDLPHDLAHLIVEIETGDDGGFWGAVAAGAVFHSMDYLDGRRPPQARDRSSAAIRQRRDRLQRAELMVALVQRVRHDQATSPDRVRLLAREVLSTLPDPLVDADRVTSAARALSDAEAQWAALTPGEQLVGDWPESRSRRR